MMKMDERYLAGQIAFSACSSITSALKNRIRVLGVSVTIWPAIYKDQRASTRYGLDPQNLSKNIAPCHIKMVLFGRPNSKSLYRNPYEFVRIRCDYT
jgi:hypothetical protein